MNKKIIIVGITGVMASGKSHISNIFSMYDGVVIYNTDNVSKLVQLKNLELKNKLIDKFGENYYIDNKINTDYVKKLIFSMTEESNKNLEWITNTVSFYVLEHFKNYINTLTGIKYIIVESAILFETGFNTECDLIICVKSPNPVGAAYNRDYTTKEEWQLRMSTQLPDSVKHYDYIINNEYNDNVNEQIDIIHKKILEKTF